ncbi:MAG: methyltransferase [Muribaculaceae bacterium]|nr:methyltransferase [Muribaculaceae bacterium]
MKIKDSKFQFKYFSVAHSKSSMKVGVDGVLIGAWASCYGKNILDVGTGCGLIALMMAQRNREATIYGIDIDRDSIEEARSNFENSEWRTRLSTELLSFKECHEKHTFWRHKFDLIVSNPPFFNSGVKDLDDPRKLARHQGELSPYSLLSQSPSLLTTGGRLSMVVPSIELKPLYSYGKKNNMLLNRALLIRNKISAEAKRVLLEFVYEPAYRADNDKGKKYLIKEEDIETLTMFEDSLQPTEEYRLLCEEFYLKF